MNKKSIPLLVKLFILLLLCIIIATVAMIFVYSIPVDNVLRHAKESIELYTTDIINTWSGGNRYSHISNSTDCIMINHAVCRYYDSAIDNAMIAPEIFYDQTDRVGNLVSYLSGNTNYYIEDYARYWHGYLLYMVPGLLIVNIGGLKTIMMFAQFILNLFVIGEFYKRNKMYSLLYAITVLFINPVTTVLTFQDADIYCIMMIFMIIILKYHEYLQKNNRYYYLFLINGAMTCFFDFLTYPLVAWGIPMATVMLLSKKDLKNKMFDVITLSLTWLLGYAGLWIGKWIMVIILTDFNMISEGLGYILHRTTGTYLGEEITFSSVLKIMWESVNDVPMLSLYLIALCVIGFYAYKNRFKLNKSFITEVLPYIFVFLVPIGWFFVVRNHAYLHPWLEYRHMAVCLWALTIIISKVFDIKNEY